MKKLPPPPWDQFVISCYELAWALEDLAAALDPNRMN